MINIRPVKKEDLDKLAEIYAEVYKVFDVGERWTKKAAYKLLKHWFNLQPNLSYLAEVDGKIIGGVLAPVKPWWNGNHLHDGDIFVHPDYQSKSIGKQLLKTILKEAIEKYNVVNWEAATFKKFDFPLNWYKRLGFKEIEEWVLISGDVKKALEILENEK